MRRAGRVAAAVALVALGAVAVWAAVRLWRTEVPSGLAEAPVDLEATFGAAALDEAESFSSFIHVTTILSEVALVVTLGLYAWRGARFARESAAGPIGTGFLLGMLGFAIVWLVQVPFLLAETWWLRRHEVLEVGYLDAIVGDLATLGATFVFVCFALLIAMGFARLVGQRWWLPAGVAFAVLFAGVQFVAPYLLFGLDPAGERLREETAQLAQIQGLDETPDVEILPVTEALSQPNAAATGLDGSRTIIVFEALADTFPRDQVHVVLAHEVAHHSREHLAKHIGWFALIVLPTALIVAVATRRRGGLRAPEAVPLALFVVVVLGLVTGPLQNAAGRRYEAEADWVALQSTRDPQAMEGVWRSFTEEALADPDPPGWWQLLYGSHPTGVERVQMARAWAARHGD